MMAGKGFPPDAFTVDSRLLALLDALPESAYRQHFLAFSSNTLCVSVPPCDVFSNNSGFHLLPFPEFTESGLKDYMGRSVQESLDAVRILTGAEPPMDPSFWLNLIRGGYQGAAYYLDCLEARE